MKVIGERLIGIVFVFVSAFLQKLILNQRRFTIQRLHQIKHYTHKLLTIFNVLPYLTSPLPADCESTAVRYTNIRHTVQTLGLYPSHPFCWCKIDFGFEFQASAVLSFAPIE